MKHALWLVTLPLIAAGCLGGSSGHATSSAMSPPGDLAPGPATSLSISYPVGNDATRRSKLAPCPTAACHDVQVKHCASGGSCELLRTWIRVVDRRLICSPSGGEYSDPKAACAALDDLERRLGSNPVSVCRSLAESSGYPTAKARGRYHDQLVKLALGADFLCGFGAQAASDAAMLMPGQ
jgi:hypothetical protein